MLSRALILATVTLFIACGSPAQAQNLDASKSPAQIFAGTCAACHKSPRGLLKTVSPGALPGFLRQHYTTGTAMAGSLSAYLASSGAADPRARETLTKRGREAAQGRDGAPDQPPAEPRRRREPSEAQQAARPDGDGLQQPGERGGRREPAARQRPDQKLSKRGKPEDAPKPAKPEELQKDDVAAKPDGIKTLIEDGKADKPVADSEKPAEASKPSDVTKPEGQGPESTAAAPGTRPDPVPQVIPAPKPAEGGSSQTAQAPEPSAPASPPAESSSGAPPAASEPPAPNQPPVTPAGPPEPPISR